MRFWKQSLFSLVAVLFSLVSSSQDNTRLVIDYHLDKVKNHLDKHNALHSYYRIDEQGFRMYASYRDKTKGKSEFYLPWSEVDFFNEALRRWPVEKVFAIYKEGRLSDSLLVNTNFYEAENFDDQNVNRRLEGVRIAIDPGHIAHNFEMGKIEQKYIQFEDSIEIAEGVLTFAVATLLKQKLEQEGAIVFMTRAADSLCAYGMTFKQYLQKKTVDSLYARREISSDQRKVLLNPSLSLKEKFHRGFTSVELAKRADVINAFKPDLSIIIHFNVDETNKNWLAPSDRNFNMCFVGGAFMRNELSSAEKRFEFLRLLVTKDLEQSIALSKITLSHFERELCVQSASEDDATYFRKGCLPATNEGVFSRNLQLTRTVHGPLVYGETLYQDNVEECSLLNAETDKCKNQRIQQVADAYFQAVLEYVGW